MNDKKIIEAIDYIDRSIKDMDRVSKALKHQSDELIRSKVDFYGYRNELREALCSKEDRSCLYQIVSIVEFHMETVNEFKEIFKHLGHVDFKED